MAKSMTNVKIQLRKDYLSAWNNVNPVLNNGELAIVVDTDGTQNIKIGDGSTAFNDLQFLWQAKVATDKVTTQSVTSKAISQGFKAEPGLLNLATGIYTEASASFGVVHGIEARINSGDDYAFVFNGENLPGIDQRYTSHGEGTFNVNALSGLSGIYIGETTLADILLRYQLSGSYAAVQDLEQFWKKSETSSASEIEAKVAELSNETSSYTETLVAAAVASIPLSISQLQNDSGYLVQSSLSDYYTKSQVSSASEVNSALAGKQASGDYATKSTTLAGYGITDAKITGTAITLGSTTITALTAHQSLTAYETKSDLTANYYTKTQVNAISTELSNSMPKITISDQDGISGVSELSVIKMSAADYAAVIQSDSGASRNAIYMVSSDVMTAAGERIVDVADAISASDAVNYGQMTNMLSDLSIDGSEDIDALRTMLSTIISRFGGNR